MLKVGAMCQFILVLFLYLLARHKNKQTNNLNAVQNQKRMMPNFELTNQPRNIVLLFIRLYLPYASKRGIRIK